MGLIKKLTDIYRFFNPPKIDYEALKSQIPPQPPYQPYTQGVFLINLTNSKDQELTLVNHTVFNWIMDPNQPEPQAIPFAPTLQGPPNNIYPCDHNDRALVASSTDPDGVEILHRSYSIKELTQYLAQHQITITEEYEGYIY